MKLQIAPTRITYILLLIVAFLAITSLAGQVSKFVLGIDKPFGFEGFIHLFNLDEEANIPTWYQSSMLLFCSILLAIIAIAEKKKQRGFILHWRILSAIFLALSIDEAVSIHERLEKIFPFTAGLKGYFYFGWVILGIAFIIILAIFYLPFLAALNKKTKILFISAGILFTWGAIGMEMINGNFLDRHGDQNFIYAVLTHVEEIFEMLGVVLFIHALLHYVSMNLGSLQIHISQQQAKSEQAVYHPKLTLTDRQLPLG